MENTPIYIYHFGNSEVPKIVKQLRENDFNVILGPTDEDHAALLSNKYYKEAAKKKIYSFMSDYWRMWIMLKKTPGIYMDTSFDIVDIELFRSFVQETDKKNIFIKENIAELASCFYYLNDVTIAKDYLNIYNGFMGKIRRFPISPTVLSSVLEERINFKGNCSFETDSTKFVTAPSILGGDFGICKYGMGSWNRFAPKWFKKRTAGNYWTSIKHKWETDGF